MSALSNLDKETLWKKFPIVLKPYNPEWKTWYEDEKQNILEKLDPDHVRRVNHIGSTAVEGMVAKPTVDILLEARDRSSMKPVAQKLLDLGYLTEGDAKNPPEQMVFMKGYTENGYAERVFHLHLRIHGDWHELYFRDYLMDHEAAREAYKALKKDLFEKHEYHRDHYTKGKSAFIENHTARARELYGLRYAPSKK